MALDVLVAVDDQLHLVGLVGQQERSDGVPRQLLRSREVRTRVPDLLLQSVLVGEPSPKKRVKGHYWKT